eukprot:7276738-Heterocapsa_arctica.AAC.1
MGEPVALVAEVRPCTIKAGAAGLYPGRPLRKKMKAIQAVLGGLQGKIKASQAYFACLLFYYFRGQGSHPKDRSVPG